MCGIAGIISAGQPVSHEALAEMARRMAHRGPDGEGFWFSADRRIGLAHRRLSIIDLSQRSAQPMVHPSGRLILSYNGEIYNYRELAARLRAEGHQVDDSSDTQVLLAAWAAWGERCLDELNGMFAFALADLDRNRLFLARDRFGEKPLLTMAGNGFLAFASEYKALFALAGSDPEPDTGRLLRYLIRPGASLDSGPETLYPGIGQVMPGAVVEIDLDSLAATSRRYWRLVRPPQPRRVDMATAAAEFRELLTDSVRLRLRSDVPLGSCLSGGLDSGAIVCLARRLLGDDVEYHAFSGRFPGTPSDEGEFIALTAASTRLTRHDVEPGAPGLMAELPDFLWHNELPMDSGSQYAQWCVFRAARQSGIGVLLDGQGADELLAGYEQFFASYLSDGRDSGGGEEAAIRARYPGALDVADGAWKTRLPLPLKRLAGRLTGRGSDLALAFRPDARPAPDPLPARRPLPQVLEDEAFGGFLSTLLRYGDRNSMAHSLEVRLPFCDHRLAEMALALPPECLMGEAQTKRLLREAMRGILPEPVRTRWRKQGFLPPQAVWLREGLGDALDALVADPAFAANPIWDPPWVRRALARLRAGDNALATPLWKVFVTQSWRQHVPERLRSMRRLPALAEA